MRSFAMKDATKIFPSPTGRGARGEGEFPASASDLLTNTLGFLCCVATLIAIRFIAPDIDLLSLTIIAMIAAVLPIMIVELLIHKVHLRPSAGLKAEAAEPNLERVAVKVVGLLGTLGFLAFLYWVIPEYHKREYERYFTFLQYSVPWLALLSIPYFWWMDGRMKQPKDAYYQAGLLVMLQWDGLDIYLIGRHIRNWLVKAFFLPLMFTYTGGNAQMIVTYDFARMDNFGQFFNYVNNLIFFADLIFACVGYVMTFRFLDSHIRSSEPTFRGWIVAVMCYAPLWQILFYGAYFDYNDRVDWGNWLGGITSVYIFWGMMILTLEIIYASATISLGYRFSNLTYRGLVANGAYRFTKHPAYVAKNLSWWLISIPFISYDGIGEAIRHCTLLFGVNLIYYLRAKTEENHLSRYPEYVEYALMMNERSMFAPLTKWLPFLKYKAPTETFSTAQDKV